jgi:hypothetical protein
MMKYAFTVQNGKVNNLLSVEWPENLPNETIRTLAKLRGVSEYEMLELLAGEAVIEFCKNYSYLKLRARYAVEEGPFVLDTEEEVDDEVLLAYAKQQNRSTTLVTGEQIHV